MLGPQYSSAQGPLQSDETMWVLTSPMASPLVGSEFEELL